ncbi:uncharacterized protein LOC118236055 isoform X2 [Anguilla anguilla]|uniref:uncharacterized protein LOC118236055 isoform X2 n=1 Tax=Anguilla anguilla TaxID=7936 RepID=UPI0015B0ACA8|nr:uncharacterized protein LOC118236055 isoform X2 [Anguilla anguilla]
MVKIFVGNLSEDTTAEQLRALFSQYGTISECDVLKKYGFVHMDDKAEADEAIRRLHHHQLNGQTINVEMSRGKTKNSTKLHVGNISNSCTNQELRAKFEEYGPVVECDIVKDYAFVHMERVEDAMEAINGLDNTAFQGTQDHSPLRNGLPASQYTGCNCKCSCSLDSKDSAVHSQTASSTCSVYLQVLSKLSSLEKSVREIKALLLAQKRPQQDDALDGLELFLPHGGKLESMEELIELEKMLQVEEHKRRLVQVLSTMEGGENVGKICRALMRALMTNGLMSQFSARGQKGKLAFKDRLLCDVILKAVRKSSNGDCRDSDIMYEIAGVLRNAPNHPGGTNYHKLGCTRKRKAEVVIKEMPVESD